MGQNHSSDVIVKEATLSATGSVTYRIDTEGASRINVFARYRFDTTNAAPSIAFMQKYAMDWADAPDQVLIADNEDIVPGVPQPLASQVVAQEFVWQWNIPIERLPKYIDLEVEVGDSDLSSLDILTDRS